MSVTLCLVRHVRRARSTACQTRWESTLTNLTQEMEPQSGFPQWSKVIREAEQIVGYPTSFMNMRWLEVDSDHPLLTTAKRKLCELNSEHNNLQPWGLVILLLAKSANNNMTTQDNEVYERQRILAELTEMFRTGHMFHKCLINLPLAKKSSNTETVVFENKICILIGDYLVGTANGMLAKLRNQDLYNLIWSALRDLSEGEFFGDRDSQNLPLPGNPDVRLDNDDNYEISSKTTPLDIDGVLGNARREWTVRTIYSGASLLGRSCQGAMLLSGQTNHYQDISYMFGCHLALAWQAANELLKLTSNTRDISLTSAPVLFALNDDPKLYKYVEEAKESIKNVDYDHLKRKIFKTDALERTRLLYEDHAKKAADIISEFDDNESVETIKNIINTSWYPETYRFHSQVNSLY